MPSNLFMYLAAMSAVSIHNLANNIKDVTKTYDSIDLQTSDTANWTLSDTSRLLRVFPECNGTRQSPIGIDDSFVKENLNLRLGLTAYERPISGVIKNQFPTFRLIPFSLEWPRPSALVSQTVARSFNPYADSHFSLSYVELHWSHASDVQVSPEATASAHQINRASYPVEIHFVHRNTAYNSQEEANQKPDGLLILAVLVIPSSHESYIFDKLLDQLTNLTNHQAQANFQQDSTWRTLLPQDTSRFYRYFGSTLLPPCHESVQWIIFEDKLKLGQKQLKRLRSIRFLSRQLDSNEQVDWARQKRSLQRVGNRTVERSFRTSKSAASSTPTASRRAKDVFERR